MGRHSQGVQITAAVESGLAGRVGAIAVALGLSALTLVHPGRALAENPSDDTGSGRESAQHESDPDDEHDSDAEDSEDEDLDDEDPDDEDLDDEDPEDELDEEDDHSSDDDPSDDEAPDDEADITPPPADGPESAAPEENDSERRGDADSVEPQADTVDMVVEPTQQDSLRAFAGSSTETEDVQHTEGEQTLTVSNRAIAEQLLPSTTAEPLTTPVDVLAAVVSAVLAPFAVNSPLAPTQPATLWAVLAWVRREVDRFFVNDTPVLVDNQDRELIEDVTVGGALTGTDADDDDLTYTFSGGDPDAHIVVNEDGSWTYTAPADWDGETVWTDSFTVTASDEDDDFHLHGLLGFLNPSTRHSDSVTVNVSLQAYNNDAPQVAVGEPNEPDSETGAVTFDVVISDPEDDDLLVTITKPDNASGTITYAEPTYNAETGEYTYTVTYTPSPQERVTAYGTQGDDVVPLTVTADDVYHEAVVTTVPVTVDPTSILVVTSTTVAGESGTSTAFARGNDGTIAMYSVKGTGAEGDPYRTTVRVLRPGETSAQSTTVEGVIVGDVVIGDDGTVALTTSKGSGTQLDPYSTTVTVLRPGQPTPDSTTIDGRTLGVAVVGADGTVAQLTSKGIGSPADPRITTVTVLRPGQASPDSVGHIGDPSGAAAVGANGAVVLTTYTGSGTEGDPTVNKVSLLRPGQSTPEQVTAEGFIAGPTTFGEDGTVVVTTTSGDGSVTDPYVATVNVLRPNAVPEVVTIVGTAIHSASVGADGTVVQTTFVGDLVDGVTTVTVLPPDGAPSDTVTVIGYPAGGAVLGADGTVAQTTYTDYGTPSAAATVAVLRPGAETPITDVIPGYPVGAIVGDDGTVVLTTTTGTGMETDPYEATVGVLRPGELSFDQNALTGYPMGTELTEDGTVVVTTRNGIGTLNDPFTTTVTVLRPGDADPDTTTLMGLAYYPARVLADGTVVVATFTGAGTVSQPYVSTATVVRPGHTDSITIPGSAPEVIIRADGTMVVLTGSPTIGGPAAYTATTITVAPVPGDIDL